MAAAGPRSNSMRSTCSTGSISHIAPPVACESTRTPSMKTAVWRDSPPRTKTPVTVPGPPLRENSTPGKRASKSATQLAPLRSMASRSSTDISASTCESGSGLRVAVTTTVSATAAPLGASGAPRNKTHSTAPAKDATARLGPWKTRRHGRTTRATPVAGCFPAEAHLTAHRNKTTHQPCWPVSGLAEATHVPFPGVGTPSGI
jgi:hypothetical protein